MITPRAGHPAPQFPRDRALQRLPEPQGRPRLPFSQPFLPLLMKHALIIAVLAACACCTASERMTAKATPEPIANYLPDTMTEREQAVLS